MNDSSEPVSAPLRRLSASLLALGRIRLELLAIEVQEEKDRIAQVLLWAVLTALLAGFGLLLLAVLVTVMLWDSHRLLALGGATAVMVAGAAYGIGQLRRLLGQSSTLFHASIGELRQDSAALRREPPP